MLNQLTSIKNGETIGQIAYNSLTHEIKITLETDSYKKSLVSLVESLNQKGGFKTTINDSLVLTNVDDIFYTSLKQEMFNILDLLVK